MVLKNLLGFPQTNHDKPQQSKVEPLLAGWNAICIDGNAGVCRI